MLDTSGSILANFCGHFFKRKLCRTQTFRILRSLQVLWKFVKLLSLCAWHLERYLYELLDESIGEF